MERLVSVAIIHLQDLDIEVFRPAFRHFQYYYSTTTTTTTTTTDDTVILLSVL